MAKTSHYKHYEKWFEGKNANKKLVKWLEKHPDFRGRTESTKWDTWIGDEKIQDDWHIHIISDPEEMKGK